MINFKDIKGNYHTHSRWCKHGCGEIEEYIHRAIDTGLEELAITEHVPHEHSFSFITMDEFYEFDRKLNNAIDRYGDQIKILKGFECEYFNEELDLYKKLSTDYGYEFLILGQHLSGENHMYDQFKPKGIEALYSYTQEVIAGIESGMFKILAHPDLLIGYYEPGFDKHVEKCLNDIYQCASENNIVCEINCGGIRTNRGYPSKEGFLLSKKYNLSYIIGADAHDPRSIMGQSMQKAVDFANDCGLQIMNKWKEKEERKND